MNKRTTTGDGRSVGALRRRGTLLKSLIAAILGLAVTALATPAMAYVVEVTASIDLTGVADKAQLRRAVEAAVDDVLTNAITFSPTVVQVQNARVVGDRMYILLLIADADGERALEAIAADGAALRNSDGAVDRNSDAVESSE